jgi:hypothetical protein
MSSIANPELSLLDLFRPVFSVATFVRAQLLGVAAILTNGRRTLTNLLRTVAELTEGDSSSYHRVLSLAQWSALSLAAILMRFLVQHFWPQGRIRLVGDDTVTEHPGKKVFGKARHRDAVRSSHCYTAWRWGHKWVVLRLSTPQEVVAKATKTRLNVAWYGGGRRDVEVVSETGYWYKAGHGLVQVRWVFVHDLSGTHRDEYFYSTDVMMTPAQIIEEYTGRWNIETTFEETRAYLGLESTCGWCERTVLRAEPCLLGLYSVVALLYWLLPAEDQEQTGPDWPGKQTVTFSDAITAVRRWLWTHWVFPRTGHADAFDKLPRPFQRLLLYALAPAA